MKFHRDFFGAQPAQFAVVGDFDAAEIAKLVASLLGDWKNAETVQARRQPSTSTSRRSRPRIETPDKAQAFFVAGMNLKLRDDDPDYPALVIGNYMLGGGCLNSRLTTRIRGKDGLSYGVGSQLHGRQLRSGRLVPGVRDLRAAEPREACRRHSTKRSRARSPKISRTGRGRQAKSGWLQSRGVSRAQDNELVGALAHYLFLGRTLAWDAEFEKKVAALDAAQIRAALKRHLVPAKFSIVKAGDFAGAAKKAAAPAK